MSLAQTIMKEIKVKNIVQLIKNIHVPLKSDVSSESILSFFLFKSLSDISLSSSDLFPLKFNTSHFVITVDSYEAMVTFISRILYNNLINSPF